MTNHNHNHNNSDSRNRNRYYHPYHQYYYDTSRNQIQGQNSRNHTYPTLTPRPQPEQSHWQGERPDHWFPPPLQMAGENQNTGSPGGDHNTQSPNLQRAPSSLTQPLLTHEQFEELQQQNGFSQIRSFNSLPSCSTTYPTTTSSATNSSEPNMNASPSMKMIIKANESEEVEEPTAIYLIPLDHNVNGLLSTPSDTINDPQPGTSGQQALGRLDSWTNLRDPETAPAISRQDTLDLNPVCVDPRTMIFKIENDNGMLKWPSQGGVEIVGDPFTEGQQQKQEAGEQPAIHQIQFGPEDFLLMQNGQNCSGPTSSNVCVDNFPGAYNFSVNFTTLQNIKSKHWDYSEPLNKLFIDMNKYVIAQVNVGHNPPNDLAIRILPIYAVAGFFTTPVRRCPNHTSRQDPSNEELREGADHVREHLIRIDNDAAIYEEDQESKRLSVMCPVVQPHVGSTINFPIKFMCLGSDVGGINRKPVKVIFTLEHGYGNVVARHAVDVRICSCPKRDMAQEEKKHMQTTKEVKKAADELSRANSSLVFTQPVGKKRKIEHVEEMILVPVAKADFQMVNKTAEALIIARNIDKPKSKIDEIKSQRQRLLRLHNPKTFNPPTKPEPKPSS